jgi:segregation and condensation protein B
MEDQKNINDEQMQESDIREENNTEDTELNYITYSEEELSAALEAVLFSMGESVAADRLIKALMITQEDFYAMIDEIMAKYNAADRGIRMIKLEDSYQLCTKNDYYDVLSRIVNMPKKHVLTDVLLETLSIIAYKQPITRPEIEAIRGVSCAHAINKLVEYDLIMEVGRLDAPGRPIMFGTTENFLRCFGVSSMEELPVIGADKIEDFKQEAMEEAEFTLSVDTSDV